jgi:nitrogenase-stabilizing/protective protein
MIDPGRLPELAGLSTAEDFFEALQVPYEPRVLEAHRLQILKVFGLALAAWVRANLDADARDRRDAAARALKEAHDVFAEEIRGEERRNPFAPGLVRLRRPR